MLNKNKITKNDSIFFLTQIALNYYLIYAWQCRIDATMPSQHSFKWNEPKRDTAKWNGMKISVWARLLAAFDFDHWLDALATSAVLPWTNATHTHTYAQKENFTENTFFFGIHLAHDVTETPSRITHFNIHSHSHLPRAYIIFICEMPSIRKHTRQNIYLNKYEIIFFSLHRECESSPLRLSLPLPLREIVFLCAIIFTVSPLFATLGWLWPAQTLKCHIYDGEVVRKIHVWHLFNI